MDRIVLIGIICCFPFTFLTAQITKEDSLQTQQLVEEDKSVRLNPEFQKAIESGTFISPKWEKPDLLSTPPEFSIFQDFSEYILIDSTERKIDILSIPTNVLIYYSFNIHIKDTIYKSCFLSESDIELLKALAAPKADGTGIVGGSAIYQFSMEDVLRQIFWKSERAKRRNRKHANAYKFYHGFP